jgi:hypothetical protein
MRWASVAAVVVGLVLLVATGVSAKSKQGQATVKLYTMNASSYSSNGDLISGWNWLRNSADTAEWTFNVTPLQSAKRGTVYINVSALVTKGVNGGAGYSGSISLTFVGVKTSYTSVMLNNPFRPKDSSYTPTGYTHGVGYQAYGAVAVPFSAYDGATLMKVIASRSNSSALKNLHIAVNKGAPVIAYTNKACAGPCPV